MTMPVTRGTMAPQTHAAPPIQTTAAIVLALIVARGVTAKINLLIVRTVVSATPTIQAEYAQATSQHVPTRPPPVQRQVPRMRIPPMQMIPARDPVQTWKTAHLHVDLHGVAMVSVIRHVTMQLALTTQVIARHSNLMLGSGRAMVETHKTRDMRAELASWTSRKIPMWSKFGILIR